MLIAVIQSEAWSVSATDDDLEQKPVDGHRLGFAGLVRTVKDRATEGQQADIPIRPRLLPQVFEHGGGGGADCAGATVGRA
jgi:hypothetical protein